MVFVAPKIPKEDYGYDNIEKVILLPFLPLFLIMRLLSYLPEAKSVTKLSELKHPLDIE
ncbi:unnamed protein product [marine sediment metagenome]|uniref:Uncharacterized protein n=1 Tax=marine sediment metagenome TaxID=412755 RepID=X1K344_9ZZZZ